MDIFFLENDSIIIKSARDPSRAGKGSRLNIPMFIEIIDITNTYDEREFLAC
jgi:hypothetical protein